MGPATGFDRVVERATRDCIPLEVAIELTHRCNLRCRHCYIPDLDDPAQLGQARLLALLEELAEAGALFLTLTGGEPLLRIGWPAVARRARELGFALTVLTNGTLVDGTAADLLAELNATVGVSVYSLDPVVCSELTGRSDALERTLRGVAALCERGVRVELKTPLTTLDPDAAGAVSKLAETVGASSRSFVRLSPRRDGGGAPLALRLHPEEVARREAPVRGSGPEQEPIGTAGRLCAAGVRYAVVAPRGDVLACNLLPRPAGNLHDSGFLEIWERSPWLAHLRGLRRADLPECAHCDALESCGRCPGQALLEDGDLVGPSSFSCASAEAAGRLHRRPA